MKILTCVTLGLFIVGCVAPPVDEKRKKKTEEEETNDIDSQVFDVEYKRYLQEVVNVLEGDDDFRNRLTKADPDDIKTGKIANELEFLNHNVRSKLDELKRQELERLRHAAIKEYELNNGIDRKHMKIAGHLDEHNQHTFEAEDLRKLIVHTAKELEEADLKRKNEFKEYEMNKELQYQEQLKHLDEKQKKEAQEQHESNIKKHKDHQPLHHPGSKQQLEEVWTEQDHLSPEDFNPKTFFHLHDLDGNGVWDANEVKALFKKELDKMYDPTMPEDDRREREEEMERMREHVFSESDTNKDQLISYEEFMEQTKKQEFQRDDGWQGLDDPNAPVYTEDEYKRYAQDHEAEIRRMMDQGLIPPAPPGFHAAVIPPGHHYDPSQPQHFQPIYHDPHQQQQQQGHHPNAIPQQHHQDPHQYQQQQPPQYHPQQGQQHYQPPPPGYHPDPQQQQQQQQYHQGQGQPIPPNSQQHHPNQIPQQHQQQHQQQQQYAVPPHQQQQYAAPVQQQHPPIPQQQNIPVQHHQEQHNVPVHQEQHNVPVHQEQHNVPVHQEQHNVPAQQQQHHESVQPHVNQNDQHHQQQQQQQNSQHVPDSHHQQQQQQVHH